MEPVISQDRFAGAADDIDATNSQSIDALPRFFSGAVMVAPLFTFRVPLVGAAADGPKPPTTSNQLAAELRNRHLKKLQTHRFEADSTCKIFVSPPDRNQVGATQMISVTNNIILNF